MDLQKLSYQANTRNFALILKQRNVQQIAKNSVNNYYNVY